MGSLDQGDVTRLVIDAGVGHRRAAEELLPLVYEQLRAIAHQRMDHERPEHTLQATALVHEAYLRLVGHGQDQWDNRGHFFAAAAEAMRRILVERARKYARKKHGGENRRVDLDPDRLTRSPDDDSSDDLLALDEALSKFETMEPDRSTVVKLRYFAGLTIDQAADVLGISPATANRHWAFARAWLCDAVTQENDNKD